MTVAITTRVFRHHLFGRTAKCAAALLMLAITVPAFAQRCGDADGNDQVGVSDGVAALRAAAGLSSVCSLATCDIDRNGSVSVTDGVQILRAAADLVTLCSDVRCADIAGTWDAFESVDLECIIDGEPFDRSADGRSTIEIRQDECAVSYNVPGTSFVRRGTVSGNTVEFTGPMAVSIGGTVRFNENRLTARGQISGNRIDLEGEGVLSGSGFRCSAASDAFFQRLGSSAAEMANDGISSFESDSADAVMHLGGLVALLP